MNELELPGEHNLRLRINNARHITLICTNAALRELVIGYLFNEGLISSLSELLFLDVAPDGSSAEARLARTAPLPEGEVRPSGLGGTLLRADDKAKAAPLLRRYSRQYIMACAAETDRRAILYAATGGVHASALFDGERMLSMFEDIGRHNTLDKLCGDCLLRGVDTGDSLLITTGRISSDMARKAGAMGASVMASYSLPTERAYNMAAEAGITLLGRIGQKTMKVFCGAERLD